jgi:hypothetical protein
VCHGRLSLWNGTPSIRIWIVGTHRILGVGGNGDKYFLPKALLDMMAWGKDIYGDFYVTPLTKYKKGAMQMVRIDDARNLVIYRDGKYGGERKHL